MRGCVAGEVQSSKQQDQDDSAGPNCFHPPWGARRLGHVDSTLQGSGRRRQCALSSPGVTVVTTLGTGLLYTPSCAYAVGSMPRTMICLATVTRVAIAPV